MRRILPIVVVCLIAGFISNGQRLLDSLSANGKSSIEGTTGFKYRHIHSVQQSASITPSPVATSTNANVALIDVPDKYFAKLRKKIQHFDKRLTKATSRYLTHLINNERTLQAKLALTDSVGARIFFGASIDSLQGLKERLLAGTEFTLPDGIAKDYNAYLDSLTGSLAFLQTAGGYLQKGNALADKLSLNISELMQLKSKMNVSEAINQYLLERKDILSGYFSSEKLQALHMPGMEQLSKSMFLYRQQLNEWKEAFDQPGKLEAKTMGVLRQLPLFRKFMLEHGALASLLDAPEDYGASTGGLQTREDIMKLVTQRFGNDAGGMQQMINGQLSTAREQLQQLKNKFPQLSGTAEMPDYKGAENSNKKTFFQRIQYSSTLGFSPHNSLLPTAAEIEW